MKFHYTVSFLIVINLFFINHSKADICTSISAGAWNQFEIWDCGHVPACGDTIFIGHTVEVTTNLDYDPPGCNIPMYITVTAGGTLNFDSGKKLYLACGSGVTVEAGGQITSDGGGASENIKICDVTVWQASDGTVSGPSVLGSGLPIELLSFNAFYNGNSVDIVWTTATESNNDFFTVERSEDGIHFSPIIFTDGAGNSNIQIDYFETDFDPLTGTSYYRLKQTDFNGASDYSDIEVVKTYVQLSSELQLYPNPCDGSFHLQLNGFGDEEFVVVVRDLTGREFYSEVIVTSTDTHIEAIDINGKIMGGTYIITASSRNELYSQKLIVK